MSLSDLMKSVGSALGWLGLTLSILFISDAVGVPVSSYDGAGLLLATGALLFVASATIELSDVIVSYYREGSP